MKYSYYFIAINLAKWRPRTFMKTVAQSTQYITLMQIIFLQQRYDNMKRKNERKIKLLKVIAKSK